jgi:hypothetical protein
MQAEFDRLDLCLRKVRVSIDKDFHCDLERQLFTLSNQLLVQSEIQRNFTSRLNRPVDRTLKSLLLLRRQSLVVLLVAGTVFTGTQQTAWHAIHSLHSALWPAVVALSCKHPTTSRRTLALQMGWQLSARAR